MEVSIITTIRERYQSIFPYLDERERRMWVAIEARTLGRGGISVLHQATKMSRKTIRLAIHELDCPCDLLRLSERFEKP
jgi:hypothetical protein